MAEPAVTSFRPALGLMCLRSLHYNSPSIDFVELIQPHVNSLGHVSCLAAGSEWLELPGAWTPDGPWHLHWPLTSHPWTCSVLRGSGGKYRKIYKYIPNANTSFICKYLRWTAMLWSREYYSIIWLCVKVRRKWGGKLLLLSPACVPGRATLACCCTRHQLARFLRPFSISNELSQNLLTYY